MTAGALPHHATDRTRRQAQDGAKGARQRELSVWAASEIGCTPEDVLEAIAEELSVNEQLRAFAAGLVEEAS
jgi:hypothetical protein